MTTLPDKLREIEERCEKATEGPWFYDWGNWEIESRSDSSFRTSVCSMTPEDRLSCDGQEQNPVDSSDDGEFIAHARTDIPKLLKVIEKLMEQRNGFRDEVLGCGAHRVPPASWQFLDAELLKILEGKE